MLRLSLTVVAVLITVFMARPPASWLPPAGPCFLEHREGLVDETSDGRLEVVASRRRIAGAIAIRRSRRLAHRLSPLHARPAVLAVVPEAPGSNSRHQARSGRGTTPELGRFGVPFEIG
jgi:hypothetical protein